MNADDAAVRVLDALSDHVCILDGGGRVLAVNRAWREFAAANPPQPVGADIGADYFAICEAVVGEDAPAAMSVLRGLRAVAAGVEREFTIEYACHSPDTQRWFELRATRMSDGPPPWLLLVHRNVTQRTLGRQALRLHDAILRNVGEGVCLVRALDLVILEANPRFDRLFGYSLGELDGAPLAALPQERSAGDVDGLIRDVQAQLDRVGEAVSRFRAVRKDGTPFWCRVHCSPFAHPAHGSVWIAICEDITGAVQLETALRASEARYRTLIEASLDAVLLTTPNGAILTANPAACRLFGRSEAELRRVGRAGTVVATDPTLALALQERERTGAFKGVLTFVRADGTSFPGEVSAAAFRGQSNELLTSMVIRDVTDRRQAEERLARARDTLRELAARLEGVREQERRRLSRELHDELGHALTDVKLDLAWLDRRLRGARPPTPRALRSRLGTIGRRVDQMAATVRDMATALRPAILDALGLKAAIEWSVRDFERRTGISCALDLPPALPTLDPERTTGLFRALQEVLANVAKHAHATSVVVSAADAANMLTLSVADDGRGFDPSALPSPGALGLVGLEERMATFGGWVRFESTPGRGTSVMLGLPVPTS